MRNTSTLPKCEGCFLKPALCMCALLPRVASRTRIVVVMHQLEHKKSTNTGRLAVRCLNDAALVFHDEQLELDPHRSAILFPVAGAQPVEDFRGRDGFTLVALDANWRQAAKMRKRFALLNIPFVRAPAGPKTYALRNTMHEDGMSTFEAVARSLGVIDDIDTAPLLRAFEIWQDRMLWLRGSKNKDAVAGGIPDGVLRHSP